MHIFAVVFADNQRELVSAESLFADEGKANQARDGWNKDIGACETRLATVVPWTVE